MNKFNIGDVFHKLKEIGNKSAKDSKRNKNQNLEVVSINGTEYEIIDSFNKKNPIRILKNEQGYFIDNYEFTGDFVGPFQEAIKTGKFGEVLVKDFGQDFYYVPEPDLEKIKEIGDAKEYHPEYHYLEPYKYVGDRHYASVKMTDGTIRKKYLSGNIDDKEYKFFYCSKEDWIDVFEDIDGSVFLKIKDFDSLLFQLENIKLDYLKTEEFLENNVPLYIDGLELLCYLSDKRELMDLSHRLYLNDKILNFILNNEKDKIKYLIGLQADRARNEAKDAAEKAKLETLGEVEIDLRIVQQVLDDSARVIIQKRRIALNEQEKLQQIDQQEQDAKQNLSALSFEEIVRKATEKFDENSMQ